MEPFPPIIEEHGEELIALCREFGVARLEVFGSVMTPEFDPERSDLDFLVTYPPDDDYGPWRGRDVDLVIAKPFRNPYFAEAVEETRTNVYLAAGRVLDAQPSSYGHEPG